MSRRVALLIEHIAGEIRPVSYEMLTCARQLAADGEIVSVWLHADDETPAQHFAEQTGCEVFVCLDPALVDLPSEETGQALIQLLDAWQPTHIMLAHTARGWELVPRLAARLSAACLTNVHRISEEQGALRFYRAVHGGRLEEQVQSNAPVTTLTIAPGAFARPDAADNAGKVVRKKVSLAPGRIQVRRQMRAHQADNDLAAAEVVVTAGRGVGKAENLALIEKLSRLFAKSAVAGSRAVCDEGWLPHTRQVGQTGATVRPKVYVACGVSGASQHIAGMRESDFVVAINRDENAPIFRLADVGVVEDLHTFIPLLLRELGEENE